MPLSRHPLLYAEASVITLPFFVAFADGMPPLPPLTIAGCYRFARQYFHYASCQASITAD